jgi:hypothetical protein
MRVLDATDTVYHHTDMEEARPIHQPPERLPLAKQAEAGEILKDMQCCGVNKESESPWSSGHSLSSSGRRMGTSG